MDRKIRVFDTTLRDGEQSPGASMSAAEKLEVAHQLGRLKVDVIEAGFPISSPGDFESVRQIAREVRGPIICGLARAVEKDIDRAGGAPLRAAAHPHVHRHVGHPSPPQAPEEPRGSAGDGGGRGEACPAVHG